MDNEGDEPFVKRQTCQPGLFLRLLDRDDKVAQHLMPETILIGKGDNVGRAVLAETFQIEGRYFSVVGKKNAEVPILPP